MKKLAKLVSVLLLVVLMASLCANAFAEDTSVYKIRFYPGNQGVLTGSAEGTYTYNASVTLPGVKVTDDRYFFKGFREAGMDNSTYNSTDFYAKRDMDYVAAYGMMSTAVEYTVNHVLNPAGTLYRTETFYGNEGDRPVVAYEYIEGYQPQAYSLINPGDPSSHIGLRLVYASADKVQYSSFLGLNNVCIRLAVKRAGEE